MHLILRHALVLGSVSRVRGLTDVPAWLDVVVGASRFRERPALPAFACRTESEEPSTVPTKCPDAE